jgi:hypothetical protein
MIFEDFCSEIGVRHQLTVSYLPRQNDVVERCNQTVVATTCNMLKAKGLSGYFCEEAVTTIVYLLNRSPTKSVEGMTRSPTKSVEGMTPYEAWHDKKPSVAHLRTFGCIVHVKNTKSMLKKLDDRSTKMVFVGYEPGSKAYRAYDPRTGHVHITRDIVFDELAQ